MLCKCHWIVLYTGHFTAFCLGGPVFSRTRCRWQQRRVVCMPIHRIGLKVGGASYIVFLSSIFDRTGYRTVKTAPEQSVLAYRQELIYLSMLFCLCC